MTAQTVVAKPNAFTYVQQAIAVPKGSQVFFSKTERGDVGGRGGNAPDDGDYIALVLPSILVK